LLRTIAPADEQHRDFCFPETAMNAASDSLKRKRLAAYRATLVRVFAAAAMLGLAIWAASRFSSSGLAPAAMPRSATASAANASSSQHAPIQELIVGTWQDDYQGRRTLTVRPDGTATMIVVFDGWKARMFTPRLQIETTWTIENGRFQRQTVGGEPADKVEFVKRRVGDRASDKIVKVTAERMVLIDRDGETRYNWRRVR
jgi:hypothetical protein